MSCRDRAVEVAEAAPADVSSRQMANSTAVTIEMRNVRLRAAADVTLDIKHLNGTLRSAPGRWPVFDDPSSYFIAVDGADLAIDTPSISALVNRAFRYDRSPLSDLAVSIRDGQLEQRGKLHKGLTLPFSVRATVDTEDGRIRLEPTKVRVAGIPAKTLMSLVGLELEDLIKTEVERGVEVRDNDLLLDPSHLLPAPGYEDGSRAHGSSTIVWPWCWALARPRAGHGRPAQGPRTTSGSAADASDSGG